MDAVDPDSFNHCQARLSTGRTYHYIDQRPRPDAPTLLCLHGFPDLWYGWRHQIHPWVARGYRVVVPDMLGYGKTDMPLEASAYSTKRLCDDIAALLDLLGVHKAVVIGHDWGSFTAGRFALWHPDRLLALAILSVPYTPPSGHHMSVDDMAQRYPSFGYQIYFNSDDSTIEIEANLSLFFRILFRKPDQDISWARAGELQQLVLSGREPDGYILNDKELSYYISNYQRGMTGPLSYYRTTGLRFEEEKAASLPSNLRVELPVLCLFGTDDATCPPVAVQNSKKFIDRLKVIPLSDVGHWVMLEAPQAVSEAILQWLESLNLGPRTTAHL
ncbi:alpha/beta-hydrolase [Paxillus ammoniavirescens]|nr:alpha/beta-hydrolase [Paxillus ammoniavirescens]